MVGKCDDLRDALDRLTQIRSDDFAKEATEKWKKEFENVSDNEFKMKLANNIDEIEITNIGELKLTKDREKLILDEITDRTKLRSHEVRMDEMEDELVELRSGRISGEITDKEYMDTLVKRIEEQEKIAKEADEIKTTTKERFKEVETVKCAEAAAETVETIAKDAVISYKAMAAGIGAGTIAAIGIGAITGSKTENNKVIKIDRTPAEPGTREGVIQKAKEKGLSQGEISGALKMAGFEGLNENDVEMLWRMDWEDQSGLTYKELQDYEKVSNGVKMSGVEIGYWNSENMNYRMPAGYVPYMNRTKGIQFISPTRARELIKGGE
jgi:hypothetical protein